MVVSRGGLYGSAQKGKAEKFDFNTALGRAKEVESKTGLTQQAISRFETTGCGSIKKLSPLFDDYEMKMTPADAGA